jgi:hypothetical protein
LQIAYTLFCLDGNDRIYSPRLLTPSHTSLEVISGHHLCVMSQ